MKLSLLSLLITLLSVTQLNANGEHVESSKRAPNFYITKRTIDSTMSEGNAMLIFTFYGDLLLSNSSIRFGENHSDTYIKTDSSGRSFYKTSPGKSKFYFFYSKSFEEVISDTVKIKDKEVIEVRVYFTRTDREIRVKKPVIYLYPEKEINVNLQLAVNGLLGFTYPSYNDGWDFTASPNGNIQIGEKSYNYLFWESDMSEQNIKKENNTGFLVHSDTLLNFLENSLDKMGFNSKESADFITFWYPQMIKNTTNHIHFLFNESCDTYAELNITPKPQNIFRVGMLWAEAKTNFTPTQQTISKVNREGFTVIEWGGVEMTNLFEKEN